MSNSLLRRGDTGPEVVELQNQLLALHFAIGLADGIFGPLTEEAVTGFQLVVGIATDGIVGPVTRGKLTSGAWGAIEIVYTALGTLTATETATTHKLTTQYEFAATWQRLAHPHYNTPHADAAIDRGIDEMIVKARSHAFGSTIESLTFNAPNGLDLAAPSLASITHVVAATPPPWDGWIETTCVDLAADMLLAPEDLFMPGVDYPEVLHPFAEAGMDGWPGRYDADLKNYQSLAMRPDGIRVYFGPGPQITGDLGMTWVDAPYAGLVGSVRPSIVARAHPGFVVPPPAGPLLT